MSDLTILSFGGGQDSTALLYMYLKSPEFRLQFAPERFMVIMADTGNEHSHTNAHVAFVQGLCAEQGVEFHLISHEMGFHSPGWKTLTDYYTANNAIGSKAYPKSCTDQLKLRPIYRFLDHYLANKLGVEPGRKRAIKLYAETYGPIKVMLGIAKGEERRVSDGSGEPVWMRQSIQKIYPLIDLGLDRKGCQELIQSFGMPVPFPSNCILCPYMSEVELVWLHRFEPAWYGKWVELESRKVEANRHVGDKNFGVWGRRLLPEVLDGALKKYGHMTDAELRDYKMSHGHCVQSKY